ncbi:MAG: hypothetical protein JW894_10445 [Bacteroidales bacterium]|nr:hypothetical protein [Bacteroidales bacterium]
MQTPYLLLPLGILTILLYLVSHLLVRLNIWSRSSHRKLWNVVLLFVFLSTAVLGLLLAIQINYKLEWKTVNELLKWHVDLGIALSFVAVFHLIWNFSYYVNLFRKKSAPYKKETLKNIAISKIDIRNIRVLIFLSGFTSTVIQVLMIREITTIFQGNEFMMGWTLGIWMLLTGTGAFLGRNYNVSKTDISLLRRILISVSGITPVLIILLNLLKNVIFLPGTLISPLSFLFLCLLILTPICLLTGFMFSLFVRFQSSEKKSFISVYALEALGSIVGGIIVSFLFINWLTILQSLFILILIIIIAIYLLFKVNAIIIPISVVSLLTIILFISPLENKIRSGIFLDQNILENKETFFGNITVTENAGEYNFFNNGSLIFSSDNFILREEYTHYALLQHRNAEKVLVVSGGVSGIANEVLKYHSVKAIHCIEINPKLISMGKKYKLLPKDPVVSFIYGDVKRYITKTNVKYDAVIMAVPDPSSLQINRYYTNEFLTELKKHLNENAVIIYGISSTGNYLGDAQANKLAVLINTLKIHFRFVDLLPGEKDYLLASNTELSLSISSLYTSNDIENIYVNSDYIDDTSIKMRNELILEGLPENEAINTNDRPIPVFFDTLRFISQFYTDQKIIVYLPLLLLLIPLFFMKPESTGMYAAGFSGASVEILLIFAFQIIYGYVYSAIGLIVAIFMAGLTTGSLLGYQWKISRIHLPLLQVCLIIFLMILPFLIDIFDQQVRTALLWPLFILITFLPSTLIGYFFVVASSLQSADISKSAPAVYAADLIGSSLGIIVTTILLVPLLGVTYTCYVLAAFNLVVAAFYIIRRIFLHT